jgi:hypothetical protein
MSLFYSAADEGLLPNMECLMAWALMGLIDMQYYPEHP